MLNYQKRTDNLAERVSGSFDCAMITSLPSLQYFFNYKGESFERFCCGLVSMKNSKTALIVPKLDEPKAEKSSASNVFAWSDNEGYRSAFSKALAELGIRGVKFGCEDTTTFGMMQSVKKVTTAEFESVSGAISEMRLIKDEEEMEALRQSAKILRKVYKNMDRFLKVGISESAVATSIKAALKDYGADRADSCAVQSGANGAVPHQEVSEKKVRIGDFVVVDISITGPSGYFADYTRTFSMGKPSKEQSKVYEIVQRAQSSAIRAAIEGTEAGRVDAAARDIIESSGYGRYFFHRTGHGIGLEVHEAPWIRQGNEMKLRAGMAFTIEPGIYLAGKFGVRIEDNLLVEKSGTTNLTGLGHELVEL